MKKLFVLIMILLSGSYALYAQENQIKRIPKVHTESDQKQLFTFEKGFWISAEAMGGISTHFRGHNMGMAEIDITAGVRFSQFFKMGAGVGYRHYLKTGYLRRSDVKWGIPIYFDMRGNFISDRYRKVVPYWDFAVGGTVKDGAFFRPTVGLRFGQPRQAFLLGISYMGQQISAFDNLGIKKKDYTSFFLLKIGWEY